MYEFRIEAADKAELYRQLIEAADALSQAMWPGKACTSSTRCGSRLAAAAPQTPLPNGIRMQAARPWKGPGTSSPPTLR